MGRGRSMPVTAANRATASSVSAGEWIATHAMVWGGQ